MRAAAIADGELFGLGRPGYNHASFGAADILVCHPSGRHGDVGPRGDVTYLCIVCTPVGSLQDVVENETSALVVQPGEIDALARALARAVTDPALRVRLGSAAAQVFANKFDVAHYPGRIRPVYQAAFSRGAACSADGDNALGRPDQTGKSSPKP